MKVTLDKKAGTLTIVMPINDPPVTSGSGKSLLVASTNGSVRTDVVVDGKPLTIGLNAYITNK